MRAGLGPVLDQAQGPRPGPPSQITLLAGAELNVGCLVVVWTLMDVGWSLFGRYLVVA